MRPFRSGNKKPMSTTVVKTSESPPQIRAAVVVRDEDAFREVPFQRNRVRASMSQVPVSSGGSSYRGEENFLRNSRYRNTMGTGSPSTSFPMRQG